MEPRIYAHPKYGILEFEFSDPMDIKGILVKHFPDFQLSMEEMEKIALITENRNLQPAFSFDLNRGIYVFHHDSGAVLVCKLVRMKFLPKDIIPSEELDRLNRLELRNPYL